MKNFWRKEPKWQERSKLSSNIQPVLNSARPIIPKKIAFWTEPVNFWTFIMFEIWVVPFWGRSHGSLCPSTAMGNIRHSGFIPRTRFPSRSSVEVNLQTRAKKILLLLLRKHKTDWVTSNLQHADLQMDFLILPIYTLVIFLMTSLVFWIYV